MKKLTLNKNNLGGNVFECTLLAYWNATRAWSDVIADATTKFLLSEYSNITLRIYQLL